MLKNGERLKGICPILATPFNEDGTVDYESQRNLVHFLIEAGVHGIALFGNASEAYALTASEKQKIAELVCNEAKGKVPLIFGSGSTGLECAVENSVQAEKNGADILMIMPPHMIKPDAQRTYDYFAAIAKAVNIPIMMQDAPIASGVTIPIDVIIRLSNEFDNIEYIKAEAPPTIMKIEKIIKATKGKLTVFGGLNGMHFYEELCYGSVGSMPACEFPDAMVRIFNNFMNGKKEAARDEFYRFLPFIRMGTFPGGYAMSIHKEVLRRGGVIKTSFVRNPAIQADERLKNQALETLSGLELMAFNWNK